MKLSAGEWFTKDHEQQQGISHYAVMSTDGDMICSITPMHMKRQQDIDNATAIAALPELIAAARKGLAVIEAAQLTLEHDEAQRLLRAALQKAGVKL